jgi:hypothetical protein
MNLHIVPQKARDALLQDAIQRDHATARRAALLGLLWQERGLSREQLIARLETRLGKNCFGASAWKDNFYRDLRVVKQAFQAAGQVLAFSRSKDRPGYYLRGQPALSESIRQMLRSSAAEVDPRQIEIYQRLPAAERFREGCSTSNLAREVVAYRIRQENPDLTLAQANRQALHRAYSK